MSAGPMLTGDYDLIRLRGEQAVHGGTYQRLVLRRDGQWLTVNAWPGRYRGPALDAQVTRLWIAAQADIRADGRHFYQLLDARILARVGTAAEEVPDPWDCRDFDLQLWSMTALTVAPLRRFCEAVARTADLIGPFSDRPASRWHHHGYRGGLYAHSHEVAGIIGRLPLDPVQKELGQVAGLFHDLGKIRTLDRDGARTDLGRLVPHEALTLELLAPMLATLDRDWADGAAALRHLWAYPRIRPETSPLRALLEAVRHADHLSAGLAAEQLAFAGQPVECRDGRLPGAGNRFWRPRPPDDPAPPAG